MEIQGSTHRGWENGSFRVYRGSSVCFQGRGLVEVTVVLGYREESLKRGGHGWMNRVISMQAQAEVQTGFRSLIKLADSSLGSTFYWNVVEKLLPCFQRRCFLVRNLGFCLEFELVELERCLSNLGRTDAPRMLERGLAISLSLIL